MTDWTPAIRCLRGAANEIIKHDTPSDAHLAEANTLYAAANVLMDAPYLAAALNNFAKRLDRGSADK